MASRKALAASLFGLNALIERGYAFVSPSMFNKKALLSTPRKLEVRLCSRLYPPNGFPSRCYHSDQHFQGRVCCCSTNRSLEFLVSLSLEPLYPRALHKAVVPTTEPWQLRPYTSHTLTICGKSNGRYLRSGTSFPNSKRMFFVWSYVP